MSIARNGYLLLWFIASYYLLRFKTILMKKSLLNLNAFSHWIKWVFHILMLNIQLPFFAIGTATAIGTIRKKMQIFINSNYWLRKKCYLLLATFLFATVLPMQAQWTLEEESDYGYARFSDIDYINNSTGWLIDDVGGIQKTIDGSETFVESTYSGRARSIDFIDENNGWAVGSSGLIIYSNDGGVNWSSQTSNTSETLTSVHFADANTGWVVGGSGLILHTNDGGVNWSTQTSNTSNLLLSVHFVDANIGWAVANNGTIIHTTDGGVNWSPQISNTSEWLSFVYFVDANIGWAVGANGTIVRTNDGGVNWSSQTSNTSKYLTSVHFANANNGWAVGSNGTMLQTTNGGIDWISRSADTEPNYQRVFMFSNDELIVIAGTGFRRKTINGGQDWDFYYGIDFNAVSFINADQGWTCGRSPFIHRTLDGGETWTPFNTNVSDGYESLYFVDANNGWATGGNGIIAYTTDGGVNWSAQTSNTTIPLFSLHFIDANNGWAIGGNGTIIHTTDGGDNWSPQISNTTEWLEFVRFADANNGWAVGPSGTILHTSDGGDNWSPQNSNTSELLTSVHFADANTGWAVGGRGVIIHTTDGGDNWSPQISNTTEWFVSVHFADANTGCAVGSRGVIVHTTDGGVNWLTQTSNTLNGLYAVHFVDAKNGLAFGGKNTRLKYVAPADCPDFQLEITPVVSITNSTCKDRASIPSGGKIVAPQTACLEGAILQYSIDETNWTSTLPIYDQENIQTIYTRCVCEDDNTVSSETAMVTTTPGACPSYAINQYCWDNITPPGGPFTNMYRMGEDEDGNTFFESQINNTDKKLYKHDGITLTDITPPGGPWTVLTYLDVDSLGNTYFRIRKEYNDEKIYKHDGTNIVDVTPAGGPWFSIGSHNTRGEGDVYFSLSPNHGEYKLYTSDGTMLIDMTPPGGPWVGIIRDSYGKDRKGNTYFYFNPNYSKTKLYRSEGKSLIDITPDGSSWDIIYKMDTDHLGNDLFGVYNYSEEQKIYKGDGTTFTEITEAGGPWEYIGYYGKDGLGNMYFYYKNSISQKLYRYNGVTTIDITPTDFAFTNIQAFRFVFKNIYFRFISETNDNKLYRSDGMTLEDVTPAGGPWSSMSSLGSDALGNPFFNLISISSNNLTLFKVNDSVLEDITPTGGPWEYMTINHIDSLGNTYFRIRKEYNDEKIYKYDGMTIADITPNENTGNNIRRIYSDHLGNGYFVIYNELQDKKLYKTGVTFEDVTPAGGPWSWIVSRGGHGRENGYFDIHGTNNSDHKLYKTDGDTFEDITPSGGPYDISALNADMHGNYYLGVRSPEKGSNIFYLYPGPCPNDLTATSLLPTSVELQWQDNCDMADEWEIEYGTAGFIQGMGKTITVSENPYTLNDLLPDTDYEYYVRANCQDDEGISGWSLVNGFNTTPSVSVFDVTLAEGDEGAENMTFQISLSAAFSTDIQIACTTADFTATAGDDYTAIEETVTILAGEFRTTVTVPILGDVLPENNEQFYLSVRILPVSTNSLTGELPELKDGLALGHILDDDFGANEATGVDSISVCGNQLILNGTAAQGVEEGTWTVLHSTTVAGSFLDPNSFSSVYVGQNGTTDSLLWTIQVNNTVLHQDTVIVTISPDSDNDGVQDCIDLCLGGDDNEDYDGDGSPDDCDCDPDDATDAIMVVANDNETETGLIERLYQSSLLLISRATVISQTNVEMRALKQIKLLPGFHVESGSSFHAYLGACSVPDKRILEEKTEEIEAALAKSIDIEGVSEGNLLKNMRMAIQPNPVHQQALIQLDLPENGPISLELYNQNGQNMITLLAQQIRPAGRSFFVLEGGYLPNGMYFLRARNNREVITQKLIIQR